MPDDEFDEEQPEPESPVIKQLRKQADDAANEVKALRTENALLQAGLGNLSEKQRKAILATHDGEITADALKATANDLGFTAEAKPEPEAPQVPESEQAEHQKAAAATSAAEPASASVPTLDERIAAAKTPAELDVILAEANLLPVE